MRDSMSQPSAATAWKQLQVYCMGIDQFLQLVQQWIVLCQQFSSEGSLYTEPGTNTAMVRACTQAKSTSCSSSCNPRRRSSCMLRCKYMCDWSCNSSCDSSSSVACPINTQAQPWFWVTTHTVKAHSLRVYRHLVMHGFCSKLHNSYPAAQFQSQSCMCWNCQCVAVWGFEERERDCGGVSGHMHPAMDRKDVFASLFLERIDPHRILSHWLFLTCGDDLLL